MDFKFLHAADIHLDSPLRGLAKYDGVPAELVRTATRDALDKLVDFAISEQVAFVVIAGDLYDGDWEAFATGLYFCTAMGRLGEAGIEVFLLYGNHDAESHLTQQLPLPPNVHVFDKRRPQSLVHGPTGTVLHGQSYRAKDPGADLAAGYPAAQKGTFNIGVLHTALTGDPRHAPYAPCHPDELAAKDYDYWALGHVHGFSVVRTDPPVVFPGNLQGRNIRETGPKGAVLVSVVDGRAATLGHVPLDVVRWAEAKIDLTGAAREQDAHEAIRSALIAAIEGESDGRPLMVRARLTGETELHDALCEDRNAWREAVRAIGAALPQEIWVEKVLVQTRAPATGPATGEEFEDLLEGMAADPKVEAALADDLAEFLTRSQANLEEDSDLLTEVRQGRLVVALADAASAVRARLTEERS